MKTFLLRYVVALLVLLALDALWLSYFAHAMFQPALGNILLDDPRWYAVAIFYPLYALGVVVFAVAPAVRSNSGATAFGYGALLGLLAYGTYDLTNLATLKVWTSTLGAIDTAWGTLLTALAATASFTIASRSAKS